MFKIDEILLVALEKKENRIQRVNVLTLFALFLVMEFSYVNSVAVVFEYLGFNVSSVLISKKIFAYIIITLIIYLVNFKLISVFAKIITQLIAIFLLFPAIIMFVYSNTDFQILTAHLLFFLTTFCSLKYVKFTFKVKSLKLNFQRIYLLDTRCSC